MNDDKNSTNEVEKNSDVNVGGKLTTKQKFIKELKSITIIVIMVFAFRSTFFEPFKIPSGSMIPTLLIGDFILVNKFAYGFKLPFSHYFTDPVYLTGPSQPKRGDVIVFKYPKDPSLNYIKRVIGLPGDKIEVRDKKLFINDQQVAVKEFDGTKIMQDMDDKFKDFNFEFFKEKLDDKEHTYITDMDNFFMTNYAPRIVPKGEYLVMGDNRDYSADSRRWGFVPFENIKGKALFVWFSMIFPWNDNPTKFRPWRIGTWID